MRAVFACGVFIFALSASQASAQSWSGEPVPVALDPSTARAEAHHTSRIGMGLTLSGLGTLAFATALFLAVPFGFIAGAVFAAVGSLAVLIGTPTWVAADTRERMLSAREPDGSSAAWGAFTTLLGVAIGLVGAGILSAGLAGSGFDPTYAAMRGWGAGMIPVGLLVSLFIGAPLWVEGARF